MTRSAALALCALSLAGFSPARAQSITEEIRSVVESGHPYAGSVSRGERNDLRAVYEPIGWAPLWLTERRPSGAAAELVEALQSSDQEGLRPADYAAARLSAEVRRFTAGSASATELALFDAALTSSALRLVSDLHDGRIDASAAGFGPLGKRRALDRPAFVTALAQADSPTARLRALAPPLPLYGRLRTALARMRDPARRELVPPPADMAVLRPGESSPAVPDLRRFLEVVGDLPSGANRALGPNVYDASLEEGVRSFQERHGLEVDGVVGPATLRQMRVPASERVRQIELAMERLRWLPAPRAARFLIVNIPAFRLLAFETGNPDPRLMMDVVVGKAASLTKTPVMQADMTNVVFRPYWNVPPGIARREILPRVERDPGYSKRQRMEIVDGRVRQRPGEGNALGLVKFLLPNPYHVYLHDTPARALFGRARRDFSHGCIRLADAAALAEFVLGNRPGWDGPRIDQAMHRGKNNVQVSVEPPIPVYVFYATAIVDPQERVHFFEDIYGHDATLRRMLSTSGTPTP